MTTTAVPTAHRPRRGQPPALPTPEQVVLLQSVRSYPAVSVVLATTPAPVMTPQDARRMRQRVDEAVARLAAEDAPGAGEVTAALEALARRSEAEPTSHALVLFASATTSMPVPLPVEVRERVVVDPTFATRDLVRALHRTPRHHVLLLNGEQAKLFSGASGQLRPVTRSSFPMTAAQRSQSRDEDMTAFFRDVDAALGAQLRLHPAPVVLVGPGRSLARFQRLSRNLSRLAGTLEVNVANEPLPQLAARCRPVLERYLLSRQTEALALLDARTGADRAVSGMPSAWLAARRERPEMLAVEEGLFYPARLSADGDLLLPADDVEHPDVVDDAVDELIELVLERGGWVALVEDGALAAHGGVALTLRSGG